MKRVTTFLRTTHSHKQPHTAPHTTSHTAKPGHTRLHIWIPHTQNHKHTKYQLPSTCQLSLSPLQAATPIRFQHSNNHFEQSISINTISRPLYLTSYQPGSQQATTNNLFKHDQCKTRNSLRMKQNLPKSINNFQKAKKTI